MKLDLFNWHEVEPNEQAKAPQGSLRVRLSQPAALYVTSEGYEVLAGFGSDFDIVTATPVDTIRAEGPESLRVFVHDTGSRVVQPRDRVFTNMDRQPTLSGPMLEVQRAVRALRLEAQQVRMENRRLSALDDEKAELRRRKRDAQEDPADPAQASPDPKGDEPGEEPSTGKNPD